MSFVLQTVTINLSMFYVNKKESIQGLFVSKELLDWQSVSKHECLMTDARCPSLLLSLSLENVFLHLLCYFFDLFVVFWINSTKFRK